jgi:hypothetical protein
MPVKKKVSIKQKKGKLSQKQSINVNIQIDNRKAKRNKVLNQQYNKLNELNKQRQLLSLNNKSNINEINKITELNNKIINLENDIAKKSIENEVKAADLVASTREEILQDINNRYQQLLKNPIKKQLFQESEEEIYIPQSREEEEELLNNALNMKEAEAFYTPEVQAKAVTRKKRSDAGIPRKKKNE